MRVTVKAYLYLKDLLGFKELSLDLPAGVSIADLLHSLERHHGFPAWDIAGNSVRLLIGGDRPLNLTVLVSGRHINSLQGVATVLEDGAAVTLFPPSAGG